MAIRHILDSYNIVIDTIDDTFDTYPLTSIVADLPEYETGKFAQYDYDTESFKILDDHPKNSLTVRKENLKEQLANIRWEAETKGIIINDINFLTDDSSQSKVMALVIASQSNPDIVVSFKAGDGTVVNADGDFIQALFTSMLNYIQTCRTIEASIISTIDASTDNVELDEIDIYTVWPDNGFIV